MACQYESLRDPLVVMFAVPVAAIGVIITLYITESTVNVQSGIGCIMLGGIVVNNAILLVDQAGRLRQNGHRLQAAIAEAGRRRLRPILMTSLTTILGLMPLALGIGEGADAQAPPCSCGGRWPLGVNYHHAVFSAGCVSNISSSTR